MKEIWRFWQTKRIERPSMSRLTQDGDGEHSPRRSTQKERQLTRSPSDSGDWSRQIWMAETVWALVVVLVDHGDHASERSSPETALATNDRS